MGRPKWALRYNETETFLDRATCLAKVGVGDGRVVVVGSETSEPLEGATNRVNPAPERGMFSSVRIGVAALDELDEVDGCFLLLIDHPLVKEETVRLLRERFALDPDRSVVPVYGGKSGHPVLLDRQTLLRVGGAKDDGRLDQLIASPVRLPVDDPGVLRNINTSNRYESFFGPLPSEPDQTG